MPTMNEASSFPTIQNARQGGQQMPSQGENWTSWVDVNNEAEQEPHEGKANRPQSERARRA